MINPNPKGLADSPSLLTASVKARAYELKFDLDEQRAALVKGWAQQHLAIDPHGDPAMGGQYFTTTLYLDTPELDVYHRSDAYRRSKYRIRRYGLMSNVFLERKIKTGDRVQKQRTLVPEQELQWLGKPCDSAVWDGQWFHDRTTSKRLQPACLISYRRLAWVGSCAEGPLRLTLDTQIRGMLCDEYRHVPFDGGLSLLSGRVIAELKFLYAMPLPFKQLVSEQRLSPASVSKYRLCRDAWGLPRTMQDAARA